MIRANVSVASDARPRPATGGLAGGLAGGLSGAMGGDKSGAGGYQKRCASDVGTLPVVEMNVTPGSGVPGVHIPRPLRDDCRRPTTPNPNC